VYDSQYEKDFDQWDIFSSINEPEKGMRLVDDSSNENTIFEIQAFSTESVGINKSLRLLHGKVEFEYKVISSKATQQNIYFCIIPMKEPTRDCFGLLEVGAEVQDDPKNPDSKYRERFYIPIDHYGSSQWHCASMFFDFRQTHKAFYSIFAPRINEGCSNPEPACFLTKNLRVYSFE
jgi:hypothetical protein